MKQIYAVVLAAGEGKRMHSRLPKVIHPLCGRPMLEYILESAVALTDQVLIVVGHGASQVKDVLGLKWHYVLQEEQLGTGHALLQALKHLPDEGTVLVLCGDTPLFEAGHIKQLLGQHEEQSARVATVLLQDPAGYGRIVRSSDDLVERIVEERDASEEEKKICEINTGTYYFDLGLLWHYLPLLSAENEQNEYYLTDIIALMHRDGHRVGAYLIDDYRIGLGINNRAQLADAALLLRKRINNNLMRSGVTIVDPNNTHIDYDVKIAADTEILPHTVIENGSMIGSRCRIGPGVHLKRAVIKDRVSMEYAIVKDAVIESGRLVKPFTVIESEGSFD